MFHPIAHKQTAEQEECAVRRNTYDYTGCLQKNGAVSKINKKFISHLTRAKRTPSAAVTVQVFYALTFRNRASYI
jgi:hypothetical protein